MISSANNPKKMISGKILKSVLVIFILSLTLLSSCGVFFEVPVEGRHADRHERNDRGNHGDRDDHRDHDERHD
jgi:hypothetical protein